MGHNFLGFSRAAFSLVSFWPGQEALREGVAGACWAPEQSGNPISVPGLEPRVLLCFLLERGPWADTLLGHPGIAHWCVGPVGRPALSFPLEGSEPPASSVQTPS